MIQPVSSVIDLPIELLQCLNFDLKACCLSDQFHFFVSRQLIVIELIVRKVIVRPWLVMMRPFV